MKIVEKSSEQGQMQGVAAVSTGSPAGDAPAMPKPLPCRLAGLLSDWKQSITNMRKLGDTEAADAVAICASMLHDEVSEFFREAKAYREHSAKQGNTQVSRTAGK